MSPYRIPEPFVVSFSGGRTSAYMLRKILDAYDGRMPERGKVIFCNTGKEREETLRFVERCSQRWGVDVTWLEYRWEPGRHYFVEVDFTSASRNGEPLEAAIAARGEKAFLPNPVTRYCSYETKVKTVNRYVRQSLGWTEYHDAVGLRADEPKRVKKIRRDPILEQGLFGESKKRLSRPEPGCSAVCPLATAGVTIHEVSEFWRANDFDLQLRQEEGNCDLCFMKGAAKVLKLIRERPESAAWWIEQEKKIGAAGAAGAAAKFRNDRPTYAELLAIATDKQTGPGWLWADEPNGSCGEMDECRCTD